MAKISFIIPVFNDSTGLEQYCKGIAQCFGKEAEVLIIDDGSAQATAAVCDEIGQGVYGIGYHCSTVSQDACNKLEDQKNHVHSTACRRNLIYLFLPVHYVLWLLLL